MHGMRIYCCIQDKVVRKFYLIAFHYQLANQHQACRLYALHICRLCWLCSLLALGIEYHYENEVYYGTHYAVRRYT